jgi:hypothetical protein
MSAQGIFFTPSSAGMFGLFTVSLLILHVHMISLGQTTVESVGFQDMRHREERTLGLMHPWYKFWWVAHFISFILSLLTRMWYFRP